MKRLALTFVLVFVCALAPQAQSETKPEPMSDEELDDLFTETVMLASIGFYDEAEQRCQRILAQKPNDPTARKLIEGIQSRRNKGEATAGLQKTLTEMIVPEVNFRQTDPYEAVETLRGESKKLSKDKRAVNIVWQVPAGTKLAPVTLHLEKIPLAEAIRYVAQAAGAEIQFEPHAVLIVVSGKEPTAPKAGTN